tara:strand:- start:80 stop:1378 length:1299 start_codon:yes stop_codon:yes gene_type:complete
MARKQTIDAILQLFQKLGGNVNDVLGTRSNISFLGKGKSPELMFDMDINPEALAVLPQSKAVEELTSSVGYAVGNKLNDIQASKLLSNMQKMDSIYNPKAPPANITDLATGTRNLDKEGLMSLREAESMSYYNRPGFKTPKGMDPEDLREIAPEDLPPPGSRGGPEDIAAPFSSAGLESIKNVKGTNLIIDDIVDKIYLNAGVSKNAQPAVRANARDFLNRIKDLEDPEFPGGPTLSSVMEADDFKFMTEGGGAGMGDPLLLVQKYFGPKVATAIAKLDNPNDIQTFAERLVRVKDGRGRSVTDRMFDPQTVNPEDFEFQDGGRVGFMAGRLVGKALGMAMRARNLEKGGTQMGYQALRKYGIEGKDISRLFRELAMDKSLVGKEKTLYMQRLNQVLKNPDDFPEGVKEIQIRLGLDPIGFKSGGLAKILEV